MFTSYCSVSLEKTWLIIYYIIGKFWIIFWFQLTFSLWPSLLQLDTWIKHNWFSNFPLSYASFSHNISNLLNMLYEPSSSWSSGQARSGWPILSWSITWMKDNWIILPYKSNYKSHGVNLKLHQWDFFFKKSSICKICCGK